MTEEELEQERIDKEEKLEALEECVERIKDLLDSECKNLEEYQGLVEEIKWNVKEYCDEFI